MPRTHHPRRGSEQFWPRKRSKHSVARVRSWTGQDAKLRLLGFIGYKAGMTHLQVIDNYPKSMTKGEKILLPSTIIECPPLKIAGVCFYSFRGNGLVKTASILTEKLDNALGKKISLPKKHHQTFDTVQSFDDVRLLVYTTPRVLPVDAKKPKLMELALSGPKEEKVKYAREMVGKEITVSDVFTAGNIVDVHGITKGKGFQGTVKRFGVPIRQHKAEKTKRGIGTLGSWTPKRVQHTVAQSGKMGFHSRTEYNKQILKIGVDGKDVTPSGGVMNYGIVRNTYLLLRGSVIGPKKRPVVLTHALRPTKNATKDAPEVVFISTHN